MTTTDAARRRDASGRTRHRGQVVGTDLWYSGQQDPVGEPRGQWRADPGIYIVWVPSNSQPGGLQPRTALHLVEAAGG